MNWNRRKEILLFTAVFALACAVLCRQLGHFWDIQDARAFAASGFFIDDAFFYPVLARNFWRAGFFTFDGVMPTDGYHPLFLYLLTAATRAFPSIDPLILSSRLLVVSYFGFFVALGAFCWRRFPSRKWLGLLSAFLFIGLNPALQSITMNGLEIPLSLFFFVLGWWLFLARSENPDSQKLAVGLGVVHGLLVLSRLDLALFVLPMAVFLVADRKTRSRSKFGYLLASGVLVVPYFFHNLWNFGSVFPISSRVKSHFISQWYPDVASFLTSQELLGFPIALSRVFLSGWNPALAIVLACGLLVLVFYARRSDFKRPLAIGLALHLFVMIFVFRSGRPFFKYYYMADLVALFWLVVNWPSETVRRRWPFWCALSVCLVSYGGILVRQPVLEPEYGRGVFTTSLELADYVSRNIPADRRVGAFWPGIYGYASDRGVMPLDGVIGSPRYFEEILKNKKELEFLLGDREEAYLFVDGLPMSPEKFLALGEFRPRGWSFVGLQRVIEFKNSGGNVEAVTCASTSCLFRISRSRAQDP